MPMDKKLPEKKQNKERQSLSSFARYSGMAFQIAAAVIAGILAGRWLDGKFHNKFPLFTTVLTLLGVFVGVYFVIRDVLKNN